MAKMEANMNLQYRKRHFRIWLILSLVLPLGFVIAWCSMPESNIGGQTSIQQDIDIDYTFQATRGSIELRVRGPLSSSGAIVLVGEHSDSPINDCLIIGQIQGSGVYEFTVTEDFSGSYLLLYNPLSKEQIESFKL